MVVHARKLPYATVREVDGEPVLTLHFVDAAAACAVAGESLGEIVEWAEGIIEQAEKLDPDRQPDNNAATREALPF